MNLLLIIGLFLLLVIGILFLLRIIRKNNALKEQINPEILTLFNEIERGWEEKNKDGTANPYQYLDEFIKRRGLESSVIQSTGGNQQLQDRELSSKPDGGQSVSLGTTPDVSINKEVIGQPKRNSNKSFFSRFRRTKS